MSNLMELISVVVDIIVIIFIIIIIITENQSAAWVIRHFTR